MFRRSEQIWKQYPQDILAVNNKEALYLLHYISYVRMSSYYLQLTEIIDLQHYRIVRRKDKIGQLLATTKEQHFLFPVNKN